MIVTRTGDSLTVKCPAKVNLFLEVHGMRPDGYHEIETVMQAVTLYDDVVVCPTDGGRITLDCSAPGLPGGAENLAHRAAECIRREAGLSAGISITLEKRIPHGAGLGGGSSDAAGVLAGLNELFGLGLNGERLCELGSGLGSDVPFFLHGGTALCEGRGERVTPVSTELMVHYVICWPGRTLATAEVYQNLSRMGLTSGKRGASLTVESLVRGDFVSVRANVFNRLDEAAASLVPDIARVKQLLARVACQAAFVTGSGAAVYTLFDSADRAREVAEALRGQEAVWVFLAHTEARGARTR